MYGIEVYRRIVAYVRPPAGATGPMLGRWLLGGVTSGLYIAGSAVFFLRYAGLSPGAVGLGLSIAYGLNMLTKVPFGLAADRWGSIRLWLVGAIGGAVTYALYPVMHSFVAFLLVVGAGSLAASLDSIASGRFLAEVMPGAARTGSRAYLKSVDNLGMALGTAAAGAVFAFDSRASYLGLAYGCAGLSLLQAALVAVTGRRHHPVSVRPATVPRLGTVWRDRPYLAVAALTGVGRLSGPLLSITVPVWILAGTDAPAWTISATLLVNMIVIIVAQVAVSRSAETLPGAARAQWLTAATLAVACAVFAVSDATRDATTIVLLFVGVLLVTASEMYASAAGNSLSYALAPPGQEGEYLAAFSLGHEAIWVVGPAVLTGLAVTAAPYGWPVLAGALLLAGFVAKPLVAWAERHRWGGTAGAADAAKPAQPVSA